MFIELHRARDGNPYLIKAESIRFVAIGPEDSCVKVSLDIGGGEIFNVRVEESYNEIKMMLTDRLIARKE